MMLLVWVDSALLAGAGRQRGTMLVTIFTPAILKVSFVGCGAFVTSFSDHILRIFWHDEETFVSDERQEHAPVHAPSHDAHPHLPAPGHHAHQAQCLQGGPDGGQGRVRLLCQLRRPHPRPLPVHAGRREIPEPALLHRQRRAVQVSSDDSVFNVDTKRLNWRSG